MAIVDGKIIGMPLVGFNATRAAIEALSDLEDWMTAYATDTGEIGIYIGGAWYWVHVPASMEEGDLMMWNGVTGRFEASDVFPEALKQPSGFERLVGGYDPNDSEITYGSRTIQIAPTGDSFRYWSCAKVYEMDTAEARTHPDTTGVYYFYWDAFGNIQFGTTPWSIRMDVPIAYVYYSALMADGAVFEERHGADRNLAWHYITHFTLGTIWHPGEGLDIADYAIQPASPTDADNQFSIGDGNTHDEDIVYYNAGLTSGSYKVLYRIGSAGEYVWVDNDVPIHSGGSALFWNEYSSGVWRLTEAANNDYVCYYVFFTHAITPGFNVVVIMGQADHTNLSSAEAESAASLDLGDFPFQEIVAGYKLIFRVDNSYGTEGKCRIEVLEDTRLSTSREVISASAPGVHNSLAGRDAASAHPASAIAADTTNFNGLLSGSDADVQAALETLDNVNPLTEADHLVIGDASPHHARYEDAEAVSAMGAKGDANPLNHDRYTDAEALAAVPQATTSAQGKVELATDAETRAGTDAERAVTPASLAARVNDLGEMLFTQDDLLLLGPGCPLYPGGWISARGQAAAIAGAFHQVAGRWPGTRALVVEEAKTNYARNPRPDRNGSAWNSHGGTFTFEDATGPFVGDTVAQIVVPTAGNLKLGDLVSHSVTNGEEWTISFWAKSDTTDTVNIHWQRSGSPYDYVSSVENVVLEDAWRHYSVTITASDTTTAQLVMSGIGANTVQIANVNAEKAAYGTSYIDGDLGAGYSWSGAPHASASTRTATEVNLDDYVGLISQNDTISFSAWVQMPYDHDAVWPTSDLNWIFDARGADNSNRIGLLYRESYETFYVYLNNDYRCAATGQEFEAGDWLHFAVALDFTTDEYYLYINGVSLGSDTTALSAPLLSQWNIGSNYGANKFGGYVISEFAVFDRVLTADEVAVLYAMARPLNDPGALHPPVDNLGPLAAAWPILHGAQTHTGDTTYTEAGSNQESRFGWGTWVSGWLQFEAVLKISDSSDTAYAMLQWDDSGTWRDVAGSEVSRTGSTSADLVRSAPFWLSPGEREYRVVIKTSDSAQTVTIHKAVLICTPGGLDEI